MKVCSFILCQVRLTFTNSFQISSEIHRPLVQRTSSQHDFPTHFAVFKAPEADRIKEEVGVTSCSQLVIWNLDSPLRRKSNCTAKHTENNKSNKNNKNVSLCLEFVQTAECISGLWKANEVKPYEVDTTMWTPLVMCYNADTPVLKSLTPYVRQAF